MQSQNNLSNNPQLIAMVHIPCASALAYSRYSALFGVDTYTSDELKILDECRIQLSDLSKTMIKESGNELFIYCRNASFVLKENEITILENKIRSLHFVQKLIDRALHEVEIYQRHGIQIIELENIGAPYFIGNEIPLEELLILLVIGKSIRAKFPEIQMGIQVLSCGELEALPIAIACNAFFVRSEASLYKGLRPEGETNNRGNLAKFYYLRNYLTTKFGALQSEGRTLPALWCDLQKKHTLFSTELNHLDVWLTPILFQKIEGVILTGSETGKDVDEHALKQARLFLNELDKKMIQIFGRILNHKIPLITGSGANIEVYAKYADYIIVGTAFKKNNYWENVVDEAAVKTLLGRFSKIKNHVETE